MALADDLSIQLYSLRDFGDLDRQLAALAALGFKRVETVGHHLEDAARTRARLEQHGLSAPTGHVALADLRDRFDWVVAAARAIGIGELYMPAVPVEQREGQPPEYWHALGVELGAFAKRGVDQGLSLGYHNHHWELIAYQDGTTPLDHLLAGSADTPLTLEVDAAWLVRGGADPSAFIDTHSHRITAVHVKDLAAPQGNVEEDGWADVGTGVMDWRMLWARAHANGAPLMVLEHDKPSDPIRFARQSRDYLLKTVA